MQFTAPPLPPPGYSVLGVEVLVGGTSYLVPHSLTNDPIVMSSIGFSLEDIHLDTYYMVCEDDASIIEAPYYNIESEFDSSSVDTRYKYHLLSTTQ
jgi:hypothetical protein